MIQTAKRDALALRLFATCRTIEDFDAALQSAGYIYDGAACVCGEKADYGHLPACGWSLQPASVPTPQIEPFTN